MKNILNAIVDILTLMGLCVAAIGLVMPWFDRGHFPNADFNFGQIQHDHALGSGICLGVLAFFVCLSLIVNWGAPMRRVLNLGMFASAFLALLFQLMIFSSYSRNGGPTLDRHIAFGFPLAMIPTCFALFFSLVRMIWTMPPSRLPRAIAFHPAEMDQPPPEKKLHPF